MGIMPSLFQGSESYGEGCEGPRVQAAAWLKLDCWVAGLSSHMHLVSIGPWGRERKELIIIIICNFLALRTGKLLGIPFIRMGNCRLEGAKSRVRVGTV